MLLHVAECVFISVDQDKHVIMEVDAAADVQVSGLIVLGKLSAEAFLVGLLDTVTLQELPTNYAWILELSEEYVLKSL